MEQAPRVLVVGGPATHGRVSAALGGAGPVATAVPQDGPYECTVVDLDTAGMEALTSLCASPLGPPVVAVSAAPDEGLVDAALGAGADDCVPAGDPAALAHAVRCAVARRRRSDRTQPDLPRRLLEAVGQAVVATDAQGRVLYWNRAAEALYGWTAEEAAGRPVLELMPSGQSREQAEQSAAALRAGMSWTGDFRTVRPSRRWSPTTR